MENRQALLAIVLCVLVAVGWQYFAQYMGWIKPPVAQQQVDSLPADALPDDLEREAQNEPARAQVRSAVFTPAQGQDITVDTPLYTAVIYSGGGILKSFSLKRYNEAINDTRPVKLVSDQDYLMAPMGLTVNSLPSWSEGQWSFDGQSVTLDSGGQAKLVFHCEVDGILLTRELSFSSDTYLIEESLRVRSASDKSRSVRIGFKVGAPAMATSGRHNATRVVWLDAGSIRDAQKAEKLAKEGLEARGDIRWGGVMNNFFMAGVAVRGGEDILLKARINDNFWGAVFEEFVVVPADRDVVLTADWWYGAKERALLAQASDDWSRAVDLGMFGFIAKPLLWLLTFFHGYVGNWGVAIILLTIFIRILFFPLSQKSYRAMEKMKQIQPHMAKIREKHAGNKEEMNREIMNLYKTYGVNPAAGCLPILIQIPVFFGLFQALLNAIELRHAPFIVHLPFTGLIWMADLSAADPLWITPILMGITMFLQQKMSPPVGDSTQQKIMLAMPVVLTFMCFTFPAGLVVYWLFSNVFSIVQQRLITREK
jgi:YidC/Oxa1 family membrane protein insertase